MKCDGSVPNMLQQHMFDRMWKRVDVTKSRGLICFVCLVSLVFIWIGLFNAALCVLMPFVSVEGLARHLLLILMQLAVQQRLINAMLLNSAEEMASCPAGCFQGPEPSETHGFVAHYCRPCSDPRGRHCRLRMQAAVC